MKKILLVVLSLFITPLTVIGMKNVSEHKDDIHDTAGDSPRAEHKTDLPDDHLPFKKRKLPRQLQREEKKDEPSLGSDNDSQESDSDSIDLRCTDEEEDFLPCPGHQPTILCRQQHTRRPPCWRSSALLPTILLQPRPSHGEGADEPDGRELDLFAHEPPLGSSVDDDEELACEGRRAKILVRNITTRVAQMREHLDAVVAVEADVHNLAIVLDIDDTCVCSPESFKLLVQNPASPLFNRIFLGRPYCHYAIAPVFDLFTWAKATGFRIFFLTARPEKHPQDPTQDVIHIHKQTLEDAHYGPIDGRQSVLICMPIETYLKIIQPENREYAPDLIGAWKRAQHDSIEQTYGCRVVAVLDDQPENIDRSKTGQMRIPSPQFPGLTPQRKGRLGLGGPGIAGCLSRIPTHQAGLDELEK